MRPVLVFLSACLLTAPAAAQIQVMQPKASDSATFRPSLTMNQRSTLKRQSIALQDRSAPAFLDGDHNVEPRGSTYHADWMFSVREPVVAVEMTTHIFDVFGRHIGMLVAYEVTDVESKSSNLIAEWQMPPGLRQETAFTHVSYISLARTKAGRIYIAPTALVRAALQARGLAPPEAGK